MTTGYKYVVSAEAVQKSKETANILGRIPVIYFCIKTTTKFRSIKLQSFYYVHGKIQ